MERPVHFCPHCNAPQETFDYLDDAHFFSHCRVCGYPVEQEAIALGGVARHRRKLLFIDDDKLLLRLLADFAAEHEFQPLIAGDGPSGIALAQRERPDLILLDVVMPIMDGYDVCRQLRADPAFADIPIILITATRDPALTLKGLQAGATLAMEKTADAQRLLHTIQMALSLKQKPSTAP
jgi:DNA-binding response OmpR family regulator